MKRLLKQLFPDPGMQGSSETTTVAETEKPKGVDYTLFQEAFADRTKKPDQQTITEPAAETATPTTQAATKPENAAEQKTENTAKPDEKTEGVKTPESTEVKAEEPVLKLQDDIKLGEGNYNFITAGKELGYEVKEDSLKAFKEAQAAFVESQKKDWWEGNLVKELEKVPEALEAYLLTKQGQSVKAIDTTIQNIDHHLKLSNIDLVKAELETTGLSEDVVELQIEKLVEEGKVDAYAGAIRDTLSKTKDETITKRSEFLNELKAKEQNRHVEERKQLISALEKEATGLKEFAGLKLHETVPAGLVRNFENGKYNVNDPKFILGAIMWQEFGQNAINEIRQKTQAEVLKSTMQQLTNTPTVDSAKNSVVNGAERKHYHNSIEDAFGKK
jgi:hypothetical protein